MRSIQDNFRGQWSTVPAGPVYWMPGFSYVLNIILSLVCLWTVAWSEGLVWFPCYSLMSVCADFCLLRFCMGYGYLIIFLSVKCSLFCFHFHLWLQILSLLFGKFWRCGYLLKYYPSPWFFLEYQEFCGGRMLWIYSTGFLGLVLSCGVRYWLLFHNRTIVHYDTYRLYVRPYWNILTPCRSYNTVHNLHPPRHNTW